MEWNKMEMFFPDLQIPDDSICLYVPRCLNAEEDRSMNTETLKRASRQRLLELLLDVTRENDRLKEENRKLQEQLESRKLVCEQSGTLAEAALKLSGIFEAADEAVRIYQASLEKGTDDGTPDS